MSRRESREDGYKASDVFNWIIRETNAEQTQQTDTSNAAITNVPTDNANPSDMKVESLQSLPESERAKWANVILGLSQDIVNNRQSLATALAELVQIVNDTSSKPPQSKDSKSVVKKTDESGDVFEVIMTRLEISHHLCDKNEAVFHKTGALSVLLQLASGEYSPPAPSSSSSKDHDPLTSQNRKLQMQTLSTWILQDLSANNPMVQNQIFQMNGVLKLLNGLKDAYRSKSDNIQLRIKLWGAISVNCLLHNPNLNTFLSNSGYTLVNQSLRDLQSNKLSLDRLKEVLRIGRLVNYMLATWTDGSATIFQILDVFPSIHHSISTLLSTLTSPNTPLDSHNREIILDIVLDYVEGISHFMQRDGKCRRLVIVANEPIVAVLQKLQQSLQEWIDAKRKTLPKLETPTLYEEKESQQTKHSMSREMDGTYECDAETTSLCGIFDSNASILRQVRRLHMIREQEMSFAKWQDRKKYLEKNKKISKDTPTKRKNQNNDNSPSIHSSADISSPPLSPPLPDSIGARSIVLYRPTGNKKQGSRKKHSSKKKGKHGKHSHKKHKKHGK